MDVASGSPQIISPNTQLPLLTSPCNTKCPSTCVPPEMALNYVNDNIEVVPTSMGTFYWPSTSSPEKTRKCLDVLKLPHTSLNHDSWKSLLRNYPDQILVQQVLRGIREGFPIGYKGPRTTFSPSFPPLSPERERVLTDDFHSEIKKGRMVGPYADLPPEIFPYFRVSPSFLIPKSDAKWRRIDNLSYPPGNSVNDGISTDDHPVNYVTVDRMMETIAGCKKGTLMSSRDIADAYRQVLINPSDWPLMCLKIQNRLYVNVRLGMGGRSSCGIFETLSKLTGWMAVNAKWPIPPTISIESILDDFGLWHLRYQRCADTDPATAIHLATIEANEIDSIFATLGWPLKHSKSQTAVTRLEYIGVIWDSVEKSCEVPKSKAHKYMQCIDEVLQVSNRVNLKQLRSLIGKLVYVAKFLPQSRCRLYYLFQVLRAGERRLRRREAVAHVPVHPSAIPLTLSTEAMHDLEWWRRALTLRRRVYPILTPTEFTEEWICTTDAAPSDGIGGFWRNEAFYFKFNDLGMQLHSTKAELLAVLMAASLWGARWKGHRILWRTDCICHVRGLFKYRSQAPELLDVHNEIDFLQVKHGFAFSSEHIEGKQNILADNLSRGLIEILPIGWHLCQLPTEMPPILSMMLCAPD